MNHASYSSINQGEKKILIEILEIYEAKYRANRIYLGICILIAIITI